MDAFREVMRAGGCSEAEIHRFARAYAQLTHSAVGMLPESEIEPVDAVERLEDLPVPPEGSELLAQTVVIKLNGGLGTSMGLRGPKSALEVKPGYTFLSLTVEQLRRHAERGLTVPLLLLNSFSTSAATRAALDELEFHQELPWELMQGKVPKVLADGLTPARWPAAPELEWCPPGHGELYAVLRESGHLRELRTRGYRYAFVANIDNTGAGLDERILAWFARGGYPLAMEVTRRTAADRKGGHLARRRSGGWVLREVAQCPAEAREQFEDIERYRFFNTNNLWLNLARLDEAGELELPLIVNRKALDPRDAGSPTVLQLESAMGAAIGVLAGSQPLEVPRSRFAPVKNLSDLLVVRSHAYELGEDARLRLVVPELPHVNLGAAYRTVEELDRAFPEPLDLTALQALK